jgi:hypothetical protein
VYTDSFGMIALNIPYSLASSGYGATTRLDTCVFCGKEKAPGRISFIEQRDFEDTNVTWGMHGRVKPAPHTLALGCCSQHGKLIGNVLQPLPGPEQHYREEPIKLGAGSSRVSMKSAGTFDILFQREFSGNTYLVDEEGALILAVVKNPGLLYERWPAQWPRQWRKRISAERSLGRYVDLLKPYAVMILVGREEVFRALEAELAAGAGRGMEWTASWHEPAELDDEAMGANAGERTEGALDLGVTTVEAAAAKASKAQREYAAWCATPEGQAELARRKRNNRIILGVFLTAPLVITLLIILLELLGGK